MSWKGKKFKFITYRFIVTALTNCTTLLGNNCEREEWLNYTWFYFFISIESSSQYGDDLRHLKIKKRDKPNILGMSLPEYQYGRKNTLKRFLLILLPFVTPFAEFYQYTGKKRKDGNRKTQIPRQHGDLTTLNYLSSDNGKIRELLEKWKKEITIACYYVGYRLPRNETTHIISEDRPIRLV